MSTKDKIYNYNESFLNKEKADHLYRQCILLPFEQRTFKIFGKEIPNPRLEVFYGPKDLSYSYSNQRIEVLEMPEFIVRLKEEIEGSTSTKFNSCLINLYRNGKDSNGWHSDNEKELGPNPIIASVSLGAERKFQIRRKEKGSEIHNLILNHGSLLLMEKGMQETHLHCLPKSLKIDRPRINLTFRKLMKI